jgi:hypothetical protein
MEGCNKEGFDLFASSVGHILQDERFIQYLITRLGEQGIGESKETIVIEGNKILVENQSTENANIYKVSYFDAVAPLASFSLSPNAIEFGNLVAIGAVTVTGNFTRKTYPLKEVIYTGLAAASLGEEDLNTLIEDEEVPVSTSNSNEIGREETVLGSVTVRDINNLFVTIQLVLQRQYRWFWGITLEPDLDAIDFVNIADNTNLGNKPTGIVNVDVGNGAYVWVASIGDGDIKDTTLGVSMVEQKITKTLQPVAGFNKSYNIRRTDLKTGGTIQLRFD